MGFRSAATAANGAAPVSITVNKPAGTIDDDVMIAFVTISADRTIAAAPAGWTLLDSRSTGTATGDCRTAVYYKVADGEGSSYVWDFSAAADCAAAILTYSDVSTDTPINVSGYRLMSSSATVHTAPSVTPTTDDTITITAYGTNPVFDGDTTFTTPAGLTARAEADPGAGTTNRAVLKVFDAATSTTDPTGDQTTTLNNSAKGVAFTVTLAPLAAADLTVTVQAYREVATATGCMLGWYDQNGYDDTNGLQDMEGLLDTHFPLVRIYHKPEEWGTVKGLVATVIDDGRLPMVSHKPPKVANAWIAIARGDYDDEISDIVDQYKVLAPAEAIVIFHHEPHGQASDVGSKTPSYGKAADFVKAYRRFAKAFRDAGADNVKLGYCAIDTRADDYPNDKLWPGSDVIDVLCHDVYNWGGYPGFSDWADPEELFDPFVADAKTANRPLIFGEIGSHPDSGGHDRGQWLRDLAAYLKTGDAATYVLGFCYYHVDNHDGSGHYWRFAQGSTAGTDRSDFIDAFSHDSHFLTEPISPSLRGAEANSGNLGENAPSGGTPSSVQGKQWGRKTTVGGVTKGEISGVAASPKGGVWAIYDSPSGGDPGNFLLWLTQTSRGTFATHQVTVTGATNADWEDCVYVIESGQGYIYIHDNRDGNSSGSNPKRLYKVAEPATPAAAASVALTATYHWKFPASASSSTCGSQQNCEAIAVFKGVLYGIQKTDAAEAEVYRIGTVGSLSTDVNDPTEGTLVGTIGTHCPSAFSVSADGTTVLTIQHGEVEIWRGKGDTIQSLLTGKNSRVYRDQPGGQGEGADWYPYGSSDFLVVSEDRQTFDYDVSVGSVLTSGIPSQVAFGTPTVTMEGDIAVTDAGGIPSPADYDNPEESPGLDFGIPSVLSSSADPNPDNPDLEGDWIFEPPIVHDVPRILPETTGVPFLLMRHYSELPRGRSVVKVSGSYQTVDNPEQSLLDAATEVYLGGHIYTVTADVAEELIDAGFTVTPAPTPPPRVLRWGYLAGSTWDDFFDNYGTWE